MSKGGKSTYFLTFQVLSPRLTYQMMNSVQIPVDEIVTTRDSTGALSYAFIHLQRRVTEQELDKAIKNLETTYGVKESNIFGYDAIASTSLNSFELIEDHPGFQILVQHEANGNPNFHRWTADGYSGINSGYNLLRNKLLAKRASASGSSGGGGGAGSSTGAVGGSAISSDEEAEEPVRRQRSSRSSGEEEANKRRRTASPDSSGHGSRNLVSFEVVMDKMWEGSRNSLLVEQQRRESVENQLRELRTEMKQKLSEQRLRFEEKLLDVERAKVMGSFILFSVHVLP